MPTTFFDLAPFLFTADDDFVLVNETIDITDGSGTPFSAISLEGASVDADKGDDTIDGTLSGTIETSDSVAVMGLRNQGELSTGKDDDSVFGKAEFLANIQASAQVVIGISNLFSGLIDTDKGSDTVLGHAILHAPAYSPGYHNGEILPAPSGLFRAIGIDGGTVDTGRGNDEISGIGAIESATEELSTMATGLSGVVINAGAGRDSIEGKASVNAADYSDNMVWGIYGSIIDAGKGNDEVIGTASASDDVDPGAEDLAFQSMAGLRQTTIEMGGGSDDVVGSVEVTGDGVYSWDIRDSRGIDGGTISTGKGNDDVTGSLFAQLGAEARGINVAGIGDAIIETGGGNDNVSGIVDYGDGDSFSINQAGIKDGSIDTGSGNDTVLGSLVKYAGARTGGANSNGIDGTEIDTGKGNDLVEGESTLTSDNGVADLFGDGIANAMIAMGDGDDTVIGTAETDNFGYDAGPDAHSDGIQNTTINLGDGDDHVIARGTSSGVRDVFIFGDDGEDIFDLQNGTGELDGGDEDDLLILAGASSDFVFEKLSPASGNITGGINNLAISNIEEFQFDDGKFDFDALFV